MQHAQLYNMSCYLCTVSGENRFSTLSLLPQGKPLIVLSDLNLIISSGLNQDFPFLIASCEVVSQAVYIFHLANVFIQSA